MVEKHSDYKTKLGAELYNEALQHFTLFVEADDQSQSTDTLTDAESIAALLLSLGVEVDPSPNSLTFESLL